jgi:hypothetical protein
MVVGSNFEPLDPVTATYALRFSIPSAVLGIVLAAVIFNMFCTQDSHNMKEQGRNSILFIQRLHEEGKNVMLLSYTHQASQHISIFVRLAVRLATTHQSIMIEDGDSVEFEQHICACPSASHLSCFLCLFQILEAN